MNFRITILFFGLLLSMLWIFGVMIDYRKTTGDQTLIMPTMSKEDAKIDKIHIDRSGPDAKDTFKADLSETPSSYGLDHPRIEISLEGAGASGRKTWKMKVGADRRGLAFVETSD